MKISFGNLAAGNVGGLSWSHGASLVRRACTGKGCLFLLFVVVLVSSCATYEDRWKTVDEGFRISMPEGWTKKKVKQMDSHCGFYKGRTAELEFEEVRGLNYTVYRSSALVEGLLKKESNPRSLKPGEEVWRVDGRIAGFSLGTIEGEQAEERRFSNVARLRVPYEGEAGFLSVMIYYKSEKDLPTVRRVLQSIEWKKGPMEKSDVRGQTSDVSRQKSVRP